MAMPLVMYGRFHLLTMARKAYAKSANSKYLYLSYDAILNILS